MDKKTIGIIAGLLAIVCIGTFGGIAATRNIGKSDAVVSKEEASDKLSSLLKKIDYETGTEYMSAIEYSDADTTADELPDISTCDVTAKATTPLYAEIFATSEKAGTGSDGWLVDMANKFNKAGYTVNGSPVSVQIRKVSSGQSVDYIYTGTAVPDGYSPSNDLWVSMLNTYGIDTESVSDCLVQNVAGVVIKSSVYESLTKDYGNIDMKSITEAVCDKALTMGYTNPFTSAAGLNFLVCMLQRYDMDNMLSDEAIQGFMDFQNNIPFVALTTTQMRDAADNGALDGFIMEYQTYINDAKMSKNYKFVPYGYIHNNPLVAISSTSDDKKEILRLFSEFCASDEAQNEAKEYGFNQITNYTCEYPELSGEDIVASQKLYKDNKNAGDPAVCVFIADVSGSMNGEPINALQESLINSMQYIGSENYIGLVSYSSDVTIELPIDQFNMTQQSKFKGSVEHLSANGSTATFDAICVGLDMIQKQLELTPNAKPMLFVLSDGETNVGYSLKQVRSVIEGLNIPVYTIGYNADLDALKAISSVTEAATINASTDDIVYQLKQMFNAKL